MSTYLDTLDPAKVDAALETLTRQDDPAAEALFSYCGDDYRFALWVALVNKRLIRQFGVGVFDLEDWTWRDAYDDGRSPAEAVTDFVAAMELLA